MKVILKRTKLVFDGSEDKVILHKPLLFMETSVYNEQDGYSASYYYEVEQGAVVRVKNFSVGGTAYIINCLDANKSVITSESWGKNATQQRDTWKELTINNPSIKYVVLTTRNEDFSTPNTGYEATITGYTDIIEPSL